MMSNTPDVRLQISIADVTDRSTAAGWCLPEGWRVLAWTEHDDDLDDLDDPREKGDTSNTDVDDNPTRAFCKHCDRWVCKLDQAGPTRSTPHAQTTVSRAACLGRGSDGTPS